MSALLSAGLVAAGVGTATLSGITGIGGGTVLIAVLYAIGLTPAVAVPLHAAVQLVSNGTRTFAYMRDVEWRAAGWFLLAAVPAPFLVAGFVAQANVDVIRLLLAVMILISIAPSGATGPRLSKRGAYLLAGLLTGSLGMFVGATGLFVGRLFLRPEWDKKTVVGTLALCQTLGHLLKILAFATVGFGVFERPELLWPLVASVIVGTFLGRWLHDRVSENAFRRAFRWILVILALKLAVDGALGLLAPVLA